MSNQRKKYNTTLLVTCAITTLLALYFGIQTQHLSRKLQNNKEASVKKDTLFYNKITKIDSLLFQGAYEEALLSFSR